MMAGGSMNIEFDEGRGKAVGSKIRLTGRVLGAPLSVEEVVTEHTPPRRKVWETTGVPNLLVIGNYRMGFEVAPSPSGAELRVFIDYSLPTSLPGRWLGWLLAPFYATWCTRRMAQDASKHFANGEAN
jgi:hypothetical protein